MGAKIADRKRYIAVAADGRQPMVNIASADISGNVGAYDQLKLMDHAAYLEFVSEGNAATMRR